jgi:hypothetical protein
VVRAAEVQSEMELWAPGFEARIRALLSDGEAEPYYRESIERLGRTQIRVELARGHLLYGEWLRRERRRAQAREQLRTAYEMLDAMGTRASAERARRELQATGETAHKRAAQATVRATPELTAQEAQVARLAPGGLSIRTRPLRDENHREDHREASARRPHHAKE